MKTVALAFATLLAGGIAATAHATAPARDLPQQVVSYADLNLQNASDAGILLGRIQSAARNVCGMRNAGLIPLEIWVRRSLDKCADEATARAVADVNARHEVEIRVSAVDRQ